MKHNQIEYKKKHKYTLPERRHTEVFTDHNDNNFVLFNLCYVHELQHCLHVCGLNELADNIKLEG